jgi:hypothetical protein
MGRASEPQFNKEKLSFLRGRNGRIHELRSTRSPRLASNGAPTHDPRRQ